MWASKVSSILLRGVAGRLRRGGDRILRWAADVDAQARRAQDASREGAPGTDEDVAPNPADPRPSGPPEHWLERVRRGAPELIMGAGADPASDLGDEANRIEPSPAEASEEIASRASGARPAGTPPAMERMREWLRPARLGRGSVRPTASRPPMVTAPEEQRDSSNALAQGTEHPSRAQWGDLTATARQEHSSLRQESGESPRRDIAQRSGRHIPFARPEIRRPDIEHPGPGDSLTDREVWRPDVKHSRPGHSLKDVVDVDSFRPPEFIAAPNEFVVTSGTFVTAPTDRYVSSGDEHWPELPDSQRADDSVDIELVLRAWDRAERLAREQRGR